MIDERDLGILDGIVRARGGFGHREHLELAWSYLSRYDLDEAQPAMVAALRHIATAHGMPARARWATPDLARLPALSA